jgi:hypothetical protein
VNEFKTKSLGIGWRSKIIQKRASFYISINKLVAQGNDLEKGQELYSYLAESPDERKIIITYLDGKKQGNEHDKNLIMKHKKI